MAVNMSKLIFIVFFLFFFEGLQAAVFKSKSRTKLVIDHDGGADDAMAIFISLLYEEYFDGPEVVGLTTVFGNVNESQSFENSQRILDKADRRNVPIYRGASRSLVESVGTDFFFGIDGLGDNEYVEFNAIKARKEHAAFALIELSKKYKGDLIVVAIASMTNIALAKRIDPEFIGRLKQIYVGAGSLYSDESDPEFNAEMDVEAYHIVVDDASPSIMTIVPFSPIKSSLNISKEWRTDVLGVIPTKIMKAQNSYERISLTSSDSWTLLDPAVTVIALDNAVVQEFKYSDNSIILCGDQRGINTNDFSSENPNVRVVYSANKEYYKKFLVDVFSADINGYFS